MSGYRDDSEALRERVRALEDALEAERRSTPETLAKEVAALRASPERDRAAALLARVRGAIEELAETSDRLRALEAELARVAAEREQRATPNPVPPTPTEASRMVRLILGICAVAVVIAGALLTRSWSRPRASLCDGRVMDDVLRERLQGRDCDPDVLPAERLPGGPRAVDPLSLGPLARERAVGMQVARIDIPSLPPAGQIDFRTPAYWGAVNFLFASSSGRAGAVVVDFEGMHAYSPGWDPARAVPFPTCTIAQVLHADPRIDGERTVHVTYEADFSGAPVWRIEGSFGGVVVEDRTCLVRGNY